MMENLRNNVIELALDKNNVPLNVSGIFKILSHPGRIQILRDILDAGEVSVSRLAENLGIDQSTISQHLTLMGRAGILVSHRQGRNIFYRINEGVPPKRCEECGKFVDRSALTRCDGLDKWLCGKCIRIDINGVPLCRECYNSLLEEKVKGVSALCLSLGKDRYGRIDAGEGRRGDTEKRRDEYGRIDAGKRRHEEKAGIKI